MPPTGSPLPARTLGLHGLLHRRLLGHRRQPLALIPRQADAAGAASRPLAATIGADGVLLLWALNPLAALAAVDPNSAGVTVGADGHRAAAEGQRVGADSIAGYTAAAWVASEGSAAGGAVLAAATPGCVHLVSAEPRRALLVLFAELRSCGVCGPPSCSRNRVPGPRLWGSGLLHSSLSYSKQGGKHAMDLFPVIRSKIGGFITLLTLWRKLQASIVRVCSNFPTPFGPALLITNMRPPLQPRVGCELDASLCRAAQQLSKTCPDSMTSTRSGGPAQRAARSPGARGQRPLRCLCRPAGGACGLCWRCLHALLRALAAC